MTQRKHAPTPPSYRRQKRRNATDLAFVDIGGRLHYLGPYNSAESMEAYQQIIAEWRANRGRVATETRALTVVELCARFEEHATTVRLTSGQYAASASIIRSKCE